MTGETAFGEVVWQLLWDRLYLGGAKLGAASLPSASGLVILGITWAGAFPALLAVAELVRRRLAARAA